MTPSTPLASDDRRSVVLAEDDPDISLLVTRKLTASGFAVRSVSDGRAAWRVIQEQRPSLVLLDIMMPGLTGVEVCRRMRSLPSTADIPVILLTARAQQSDVQEGLDAGADDYFVKPFSPRALLERIDQFTSAVLT
jgi:DNA-binding response OmpR family regulator